MATRIAFLRGINVGGHRVKMDELRALFERAGFRGVATFIASGNVIFEGGRAAQERQEHDIEGLLEEALGYAVPTFVRDMDEVHAAAGVPPFEPSEIADPAHTVHVMFLREPADRAVRQALLSLDSEVDTFRFSGREAFWLTRGKMSESPLFGGALAKATASLPHTMRNVTSLRKLLAKHG